MKISLTILALAAISGLCGPVCNAANAACEDGHWIDSVSGDGEIIKLEDDSIWRVDPADTGDSALWLPTSNIVICDDDTLINTDDDEKVSAVRID